MILSGPVPFTDADIERIIPKGLRVPAYELKNPFQSPLLRYTIMTLAGVLCASVIIIKWWMHL